MFNKYLTSQFNTHSEDGDLVTDLNIMYKLELNTFNNMSVLSWRSVLLVEETRGTRPLS